MSQNEEETYSIKRYLLGDLTSTVQEQIEERIVSDSAFKEHVLIVEDDLIEDYLENKLSDADRERFAQHFLATTQQIQKVNVARALEDYFSPDVARPVTSVPIPSSAQKRRKARPTPNFRLSRPVLVFSAVVFLGLIVGGTWFAIQRWRSPRPVVHESARNREFQRELERLNSNLSKNGPPLAVIVTLPPFAVRGGGQATEIKRPAENESVEVVLTLPPGALPYRNFRTVLQMVGDPARFNVDNLPAAETSSGKAVSLKIPAKFLSRGDYLVDLNGQNASGQFDLISGYTFRVTD